MPTYVSNSQTLPAPWAMPLVIANALVAVAVTAPLAGLKPSEKWRSLWAVWLLMAYVAASVLIRGFDLIAMYSVLLLGQHKCTFP